MPNTWLMNGPRYSSVICKLTFTASRKKRAWAATRLPKDAARCWISVLIGFASFLPAVDVDLARAPPEDQADQRAHDHDGDDLFEQHIPEGRAVETDEGSRGAVDDEAEGQPLDDVPRPVGEDVQRQHCAAQQQQEAAIDEGEGEAVLDPEGE